MEMVTLLSNEPVWGFEFQTCPFKRAVRCGDAETRVLVAAARRGGGAFRARYACGGDGSRNAYFRVPLLVAEVEVAPSHVSGT